MIDHIIVQRVDVKCCTIPGPLEGGESGTAIEITGFSQVMQYGKCGPLDDIQILDSKIHGDSPSSPNMDGVMTHHCGNLWAIVYRGNEVFNLGGVTAVGGENGLFFSGVNSGLMEYNHVHHLGANYTTPSCGGPVAMWAYDSSNVTIQFNEVDHTGPLNYVAGSCDYGAFDFDALIYDSVMQYNYSHESNRLPRHYLGSDTTYRSTAAAI
jgi:hypothetical protein